MYIYAVHDFIAICVFCIVASGCMVVGAASAAGRRNSPSHSNKYCQHSAEDDYYYNNYGYGYYAYLYGDQYPVHTGSQRSSQRMDLKYTPPSSRISQVRQWCITDRTNTTILSLVISPKNEGGQLCDSLVISKKFN